MIEEEDGMGFAGLIPSRAEIERDEDMTNAYAEGRADQIDEFAELLPGPYYMDPPDGGNVTVLEQFKRMAHDARLWREQSARIAAAIDCELKCEGG